MSTGDYFSSRDYPVPSDEAARLRWKLPVPKGNYANWSLPSTRTCDRRASRRRPRSSCPDGDPTAWDARSNIVGDANTGTFVVRTATGRLGRLIVEALVSGVSATGVGTASDLLCRACTYARGALHGGLAK